MKVKLKIESQWLQLERKSMSKLKAEFEAWEKETLRKAREAKDLRDLREVFYELGDGWEWDQATGSWLSEGEPLDAVGLVLRMPSIDPDKMRFVVYTVLAYSKGLTNKFDHLGDKERVIIEIDKKREEIRGWSTSAHGVMDLFPIDLSQYSSLIEVLHECYLVAQPGDHALRIENPKTRGLLPNLAARLWKIAGGGLSFTIKEIDILGVTDIEDALDFRFARYAKAVVDLEVLWIELTGSAFSKAKEVVVDRVPDHIEQRDKHYLRRIEGLLHLLWFKPPIKQLAPARRLYEELSSEPTPTDCQRQLIPSLGELVYSLNDIIEKAKYLKWKSVIEKREFRESDAFRNLELTPFAKEAMAVALDDILREHTLSYIGYPERATMRTMMIRSIAGIVILPYRLLLSFKEWLKASWANLMSRISGTESENQASDVDSKEAAQAGPDQ
jgi:hypothetical protein